MNANATKKVLVIDDDPVVGKSFDRVLAGKGYAVIHAGSGAEALERIARDDYDVVYTDVKMPGMSGLEVARRIKASRPWLPVVIVTGYGTDANEAEARELGATAFLRKPLSPEMIEGSLLEASNAPAVAPAAPVEAPAAASSAPAAKGAAHFAKNVALFAAAPFIGLAYVLAAPFVGMAMVAWFGVRAMARKAKR